MAYYAFKNDCNMILILVCLLTSIVSARDLFKQEREVADIQFSYHTLAPVEFEIRIGYKDPFYRYGQFMADSLTPSQQRRLRVNSWHSVSEEHLLVHLQFNGVEKTDGGTYICHLIKNGELIINSTQIVSLAVDFPPRPAECWVLPQADYDDWDIIQCAAIGGRPPGELSCFQNNTKSLPDGTNIQINGTHILQKFWFNNNLPVVCCSHIEMDVQSKDCNDFAKQLPKNTEHSIGNFITNEPHEQTSQYAGKQILTPKANDPNETYENQSTLNLYIFPTVLVVAFIVFLVLFSFIVYFKFFQTKYPYDAVDTKPAEIMGQEINTEITAPTQSENMETEFNADDLKERKEFEKGLLEKKIKNTKAQSMIDNKENSLDISVENNLRGPPITKEHDQFS